MKIAIFHPKSKPMPPQDYSPVESVIWETSKHLKRLRHKVRLLEFDLTSDIPDLIGDRHYDFCHIHYDKMFMMVPVLHIRYPHMKIGMSSHYSYLADPEKRKENNRENYFNWLLRNQVVYHFPVSQKDRDFYHSEGIPSYRLNRLNLGVPGDLIKFEKECEKPLETICLGKITQDRFQFMLQMIPSVSIAGPLEDNVGINPESYLGTWSRDQVYSDLTKYGNFVFISFNETKTPTVIKEALCAGLGVVTTEECAVDLDVTQPFIDIIPKDKINNMGYLKATIMENRMLSLTMRNYIRDYGMKEFAWSSLIKDYEQSIKDIVKQ